LLHCVVPAEVYTADLYQSSSRNAVPTNHITVLYAAHAHLPYN